MKIKDYKCKCGHDDFFFADKGNQKGIYCSYCGKWLKWADKDEQNLRMKQASMLDKIRVEIESKCDRINSLASVLPYTAHREIQELLCEIMDLYKVESEVKDGNDD